MGKYQAYPEYKDSGVEWVGEIPSLWTMWKLSHAYDAIGSGTTPTSNNEVWFQGYIPWVTTGELRETVIYDTFKKISKLTIQTFSALRIYPAGSVVIAMYGATIGRLGILGVDATTNQACCVMTTSKVIHNKYLYYWLQAFKEDIIQLSSGGGQPNINQEKVASLRISSPNWKDQTHIATFLDYETAKIDNLIEKQQQLIELLKEKRQAVISHAVTKGLNPDVPMKDSGVEWLGEVPEHWTISKLGYHALKIGSGKTPRGGAEIYQDEGILFLRSQNIYNTGLRINSSECVYISEAIHKEMNGTHVLSGDILLNITGGSIGRSCLVPNDFPEANVNQHVCILRFSMHLREFVSFFMKSNSIKEQIDASQTGGNREGLNFEQISKLQLCLPPDNKEINSIIKHVKKTLILFDSLEQRAIDAIKIIQERRTSLISAAVTGKIDVRHWVAPDNHNAANTESQELTA